MITEQTIRQACNQLADLLIKKNHDYGNSVQEQFDEYGESSLLIRLDDKLRRLKQLQKAPAKVTSEKKTETWIDAAGYSVLAHICLSSEALKSEVRQLATQKSPFEEQHDLLSKKRLKDLTEDDLKSLTKDEIQRLNYLGLLPKPDPDDQ